VVGELADAVASKEAYAEEVRARRLPAARPALRHPPPCTLAQTPVSPLYLQARQAGAVAALTRLVKRVGDRDEALLASLCAALATLSGPLASGDRLRELRYGGVSVTVKEGALGDGVGAKVWHSAHAMCRELVAHPEVVAGLEVLEIGAGCGVCGLVAAALGARHVALTDYVDRLLVNLRDAVHLNAAAGGAAGGEAVARVEAEARGGDAAQPAWEAVRAAASALHEVGPASRTRSLPLPSHATPLPAARQANMSVRFLDWSDSVRHLDSPSEAAHPQGQEARPARAALDGPSDPSSAPGVPPARRFDVVLAAEVLYEWPMAEFVPAVLAHRLAPGGRALMFMAVRDLAMYEAMVGAMRLRGLRVGARPFHPHAADGGLAGREADYEGGYRMLGIEHEDAPAPDWHRDLFAGSSEGGRGR
jgi:hypothetical protein